MMTCAVFALCGLSEMYVKYDLFLTFEVAFAEPIVKLSRLELSPKGVALRDAISDMFRRHEKAIAGTEINDAKLNTLNDTLKLVERFWASQANFSGGGY